VKLSPAPYFDLDEEFHLQKNLLTAIGQGKVLSAHDCADGGLFITLFESSLHNNLGFSINTRTSIRKDACLFGEAQSRVVVTIKKEDQADFEAWLSEQNQSFEFLGTVTSGHISVDGSSFGKTSDFADLYLNAFDRMLS
jgi:phosphoribosylformylglycinamidine synthase